MSIQSILNQEAINMLTNIKHYIDNANTFDSNQMICYTLRACLSELISLEEKTSIEKNNFENELISTFKQKNWIK